MYISHYSERTDKSRHNSRLLAPCVPKYLYLSLLLIFVLSCAKEIYTDEDAANAKRESQKAGLTVMIRNIGSQTADLSGFTVSASQCGELTEEITSADGIANLMAVRGDVLLSIRKDGFISATAIVTANSGENERSNTVAVIPVFQQSGSIAGKVSVKLPDASEEPLADAAVSINMYMTGLMRLALQGFGNSIEKYCPGVLTYSLPDMMQPVRTGASGEFQITVPVTFADIAYTVDVHETALTSAATVTVVTGGQDSRAVNIETYRK